ncbi:MAG: hypothetical protein ACREEM_45470 [Blastocatellia bacterium]
MLRGEKRFAAGFNFLTTYTWSKFLNDTDEGGNALGNEPSYANYYDRDSDYGPSGNDIRHRFTISSVYELPVGRGKRYLPKGPLGVIAGNWSVGLLALTQTGPPTTVTTQTNNTNAFHHNCLSVDLGWHLAPQTGWSNEHEANRLSCHCARVRTRGVDAIASRAKRRQATATAQRPVHPARSVARPIARLHGECRSHDAQH